MNNLTDHNNAHEKRAFTIKEAAEYACVSRTTVENWLSLGILPYENLPGRGDGMHSFRRIRKNDLDRFLNIYYKKSINKLPKEPDNKLILLPKVT